MPRLCVREYCPALGILASFARTVSVRREGIHLICVANGLPEALTGSEQAADSGPLLCTDFRRVCLESPARAERYRLTGSARTYSPKPCAA